MSTHANRVKMTVTSVASSGTGDITLNAASTGFRSFATAYGANATVDILITEGTTWEIARNCTYTHSGTTVSRGTLENSSTGSAVAFTSAAVVSVIAAAEFGNNAEMAIQAVTPGGRLTTESGVPVSVTDRTAQSTLYYTPYVHNIINLWDGSQWKPITFTEHTVTGGTLSGLTSGKPYDVFAYLSSGALATELLVWTNDTTRATAVTLQDGRYCKSGDKTRLLLGTIYTTDTDKTADAALTRYVSNVYNTVTRSMYSGRIDGVAHAYTTFAWREWNGGTGAVRCKFILSLPSSSPTFGENLSINGNDVLTSIAGIGIDSTSAPVGSLDVGVTTEIDSTVYYVVPGSVTGLLGAGHHYAAALEAGQAGGYYNFYNIFGTVNA